MDWDTVPGGSGYNVNVSATAPYQVLLYYQFVPIEDPAAFAEEHHSLCARLGLRGRILVASEGLNGTVSGPAAACEEYKATLHADPRFASMVFKVDPSEGHVFQKLFVRVRPEIITMEEPVDMSRVGGYVSGQDFLVALDDPETLVLDGRNLYESEVGHFRGAICPPLENFRDFKTWIRENLSDAKQRRIVTYCTGGIRCEKLTAWMLGEGFENVWQLEGGIVSYGRDPSVRGEGFEGLCFVFDERIAVPVSLAPDAITPCRACGSMTSRYVNCLNVECNLLMPVCESCQGASEDCCSEDCRKAKFKREAGAKLVKNQPAKRKPAPRTTALS